MPTATLDGIEEPWGALIVKYRRHPETERGPSRNTIRTYQADLTGLASVTWISSGRIILAYLHSWLADQVDSGAEPTTLQRCVSCARGFFAQAYREGFITPDPTTRLRTPRQSRNPPEAPTETQVDDTIASLTSAAANGDPIALHGVALVELPYVSGLRISEAYGPGLHDMDFENSTVWVLDKGDKERTVPMGAPARRALDTWLMVRGRTAVPGSPPRLLLGARGGGLDPRAARHVVHAATAAGDASVESHALWRAMATRLLVGGMDLRSVQELLGHAPVATIQRYIHIANGRLRVALQQTHPQA